MDLHTRKLLNVFVVEDSFVVRESLDALLSRMSGVVVVGFAVDEAQAIERFDMSPPDVVILDLHLRKGAGMNVLEHVKKYHPETKVIVLSNCTNESYASRCKQARADYFFDKAFQFMLVRDVLEYLILTDMSAGEVACLQ